MPANVVKPGQEKKWTEAKAAARKQYPDIDEDSDRFWAIVNHIFGNMTHRDDDAKSEHSMESNLIGDVLSAHGFKQRDLRVSLHLRGTPDRQRWEFDDYKSGLKHQVTVSVGGWSLHTSGTYDSDLSGMRRESGTTASALCTALAKVYVKPTLGVLQMQTRELVGKQA
jgi:hypothetical protein